MSREASITAQRATQAGEFLIELPGSAEYASTARLFSAAVARHFRCSTEQVEDLKLAVSEVVAFATRSPSSQPLRIVIRPEHDRLLVEVEHDAGFDALLQGAERDSAAEFGVAVIESLFPDMSVQRSISGVCVGFALTIGP